MKARNKITRWVSVIGVVFILAIFSSLIEPAEGAPGKAVLVSPSGTIEGSTIAFTWKRVPGATWYYLFINDSTGIKVKSWYTAGQVGGASGGNNCSVILSTELVGTGQWWIQTWNNDGNGQWSDAMTFTVSDTAPTWHQILPSNDGTPCNSSRFKCVMNNEAVLDRETGLVWERSPNTTTTEWITAIHTAPGKTIGNRLGWRLPTVEESLTLVDPTQSDPVLPNGHPFTNVNTSERYWTATTYVNDPAGALSVRFLDGSYAFQTKSSVFNLVWHVRGGYGYNSQLTW
ncbi:MAG: DUF1566 domain-containing protein [Deltaproteobacteria bacterium]|nr:DUF1566 domain-containing protein [Deltaproteobacteria bacterium]MDL1959860.1 DUF1566 domain-containing protein [Deltaproteobacteria bacterium]MDL1962057.1 DUF1566 domain-containing protein [Deltaproteobacteria bacterium]